MQIVDYESRFARPLVELWRASFEHGVGIVDPHPIEEQLGYFIEQVVPNNRVRIALEDDETTLAGFMASTPDSISQLYVRVQDQRLGIGSRLLEQAKAESSGSLWLHTFAQNGIARRFYEARGFREVERESENMWKLEAIKYRWVRAQW